MPIFDITPMLRAPNIHQGLVEKYIDKDRAREDFRGVKRKAPVSSAAASVTSSEDGQAARGGVPIPNKRRAEGAAASGSTVAIAKSTR